MSKAPFRGRMTWDPEKKRFTKIPKRDKERVHNIISDELPEPVQSNATFEGKKFTSKSALRRHYQEHGFKETGGEHLKEQLRRETQEDRDAEIRRDKEIAEQAYMDVKYNRIEFTEQEKENHLREERAWGKKNYRLKNPY